MIDITPHKKTIGTFAVVMLAIALAGVVVATSEDSEAATTYELAYKVGGSTYQETFFVNSTELKSLGALGASVPTGQKFDGWDLGGVIVAPGSTIALSASGTTTVTAIFSDIIYTVTFKDGSDVISDISGKYGDAVTIPTLPDTATHLFGGWEPTPSATIKGDAVYQAVWNQIYTVSWKVGGAVVETGDILTLNKPVDPTMDRHTFSGWFDEKNVKYSATYKFTQDTIFSAVFIPDTLTVTYMAGDEVVMTDTVLYGEKINEPSFMPDGYVAWDWNFNDPVLDDLVINALTEAPPYRDGGGMELAWTLMVVFLILAGVMAVIIIKTEMDKKKNKT